MKYDRSHKWHTEYLNQGVYDIAKENEPREAVIQHLKEAGMDASGLTHEASGQAKQQNFGDNRQAPTAVAKSPTDPIRLEAT